MIGLGFRIKSGYAVVVVLEGSVRTPSAVARHIVELCDPGAAETRQPYHDGFGTEQEDAREIARRVRIVRRCADRAIAALLRDVPELQTGGRSGGRSHSPAQAGLVVGSLTDPDKLSNPHIRAHANEGRLFRTVVEDALRTHSVSCSVILEKQLASTAAASLRRDAREIEQMLAGFGKAVGKPWRTDEKAAAIAAWMALQ